MTILPYSLQKDKTPITLSLSKGGWPSHSCFDGLNTDGLMVEKYGDGTLISGRRAFQKPVADGVKLWNAIRDVPLSKEITVV